MNHKSVKWVRITSGDRFKLPLFNPSLESVQTFWGSVQKVKIPLEIFFYTHGTPTRGYCLSRIAVNLPQIESIARKIIIDCK